MKGTGERPRFSVFRSNNGFYVQLIDDVAGTTVVSANSREAAKNPLPKSDAEGYGTKEAAAYATGRLLAEKAKGKGVEKAVFDRGGYKYHGRVKAAAEGARSAGLVF